MEAGRREDAVAILREGHARFPDDAEICLHLGWVLNRLGDGDALVFARRALELSPSDAGLR